MYSSSLGRGGPLEAPFETDGWDYKAYELRAYSILSQPRGRAALERGGIVWRLALEILGPEALGRAMDGPSQDVWRHGRELRPERGDSLYSDALSDYELDIVCGVYHVYTGKLRHRP